MELHAHDIALRHDRGELSAVGCRGDDARLVRRAEMVAVHEIEVAAALQAVEQPMTPDDVDLVPADMRHALACLLALEAHHAPRDQAQAAKFAAFLARIGEQLHAEADTQHRQLATSALLDDRLIEAVTPQILDRLAEGTDPWDHHTVAGAQVL